MGLYWADFGIGSYGSPPKEGGYSLNTSFNILINKTLYKARYSRHNEFWLFGPMPSERYSSLGLLAGKGINRKYACVYFSAGLGITGGIKRGKFLYQEPATSWLDCYQPEYDEPVRFLSPAIPLEIDVNLELRYAAVGMTVFGGDLNLSPDP